MNTNISQYINTKSINQIPEKNTNGSQKYSLDKSKLNDCFQSFINDRHSQQCSLGTINFYQEKFGSFKNFLKTHNVDSVQDVSPNLIREFINQLRSVGHNPGGIHAHYRTIKAFLNWWEIETESLEWKNPIKHIKPPKVPLEILEPITGKNAGVLLDSCSRISFFGLRDRAIILTLMDTGIRANELLSINLKDLFLNSCEIWIRKGKGGKFRKVFICEQTQQSIRAYLHQRSDDSPFLWITKSKTRLKYSGLREIMRRRSKRTGIPQPSLHSFRRFFALQMLRNGADIFSLQQLMGHADITILRRYLKQTDQDLKHAHEINSPVAFSNRVLDE